MSDKEHRLSLFYSKKKHKEQWIDSSIIQDKGMISADLTATEETTGDTKQVGNPGCRLFYKRRKW